MDSTKEIACTCRQQEHSKHKVVQPDRILSVAYNCEHERSAEDQVEQ